MIKDVGFALEVLKAVPYCRFAHLKNFNSIIKIMNSSCNRTLRQLVTRLEIRQIFSNWTALGLIFAAIFSSGCSSTNKPASASFAGVIINNYSAQQIRDATETVFSKNGYQSSGQQGDALVFE